MALTPEQVNYVAHLARLTLTPAEVELFTRQLNDILDHVEKLNELDTTGVPPMAHVLAISNAFRADAVNDSLPLEQSLQNAPAQERGGFLVPRVI
ncbi:MAG: Asp-tRNA(Asn)/Glu-tRNA(Gln) amidotransferase subunit GatC [Deltaproteobacteria bacterium]|nr:Asp-tRNA(Asn)/Glu-tRNA(Gln) amidotransferase subunit GatC [Deltaproteobacteria bacterium]MBW1953002.1 Asp-tRNA(Asn)/Glu-tRNA(Gln) amidotransferase subunit GatC [Deltaproteobacteria bacterium]MBW1985939.1 Asp-tRNA(Asn)/Glu-tRNA(Gln) amidotransferase subunit GatC [Deltaproteobacteria bacterium]MBW2133699.1 Asp-tRNA(Asn)/Glu-tRNA(Gln) amidotransferase subunit GatC [Deltaproteobacteria bacterium]